MARSCAVCNGDGIKLCGQCKNRCYCSAECQRLDWKTHKSSCPKSCQRLGKGLDPVELFVESPYCRYVPIPGKGAGVVAKDFIAAGEIIIQDEPLLCISGEELGLSDICSETNRPAVKFDRQHALINEKFQRLSETDQAKVGSNGSNHVEPCQTPTDEQIGPSCYPFEAVGDKLPRSFYSFTTILQWYIFLCHVVVQSYIVTP